MLVSTSWLQEWLVDPLPEDLASRLTLAGFEVDNLKSVLPKPEHIVLGTITDITEHPDSPNLHICTVQTAEKVRTIVCGAPTIPLHTTVLVACPGSEIGTDIIQAKKIGTVTSEGLLLAYSDLHLEVKSTGIITLPTLELDSSVASLLQDQILDISITPNRGDCLSIKGLATEVAAITDNTLKPPTPTDIQFVKPVEPPIPVHLNAPACPAYAGVLIRNIDNSKPSPWWVQHKLVVHGMTSISPVVDILNYVMLEQGHPLHAFDATDLTALSVEFARPGSQLKTLTEQTLELTSDHLVITNAGTPIALAGIIGGQQHAVTPQTTSVFLECAWFQPTTIRRTNRHFHLNTEAAYRFERGVKPDGLQETLVRALDLLHPLIGGDIEPLIITHDKTFEDQSLRTLLLRPSQVKRVLGICVAPDKIHLLLTKLGFTVLETDKGLHVTVPSHRHDIHLEIDLIEEVGRLIGINAIPAQRPTVTLQAASHTETAVSLEHVKDLCVALGYREVITYSFINPAFLPSYGVSQTSLTLKNPISADLSLMRSSLWPGLLQTLQYNQRRQQNRLKIFEVGKVFQGSLQEIQQPEKIAGLISISNAPEYWQHSPPLDFFTLKGELTHLWQLTHGNSPLKWQRAHHDYLHPGQSACLYHQEQEIGVMGVLHPRLLRELELEGPVVLFEVHWSAWQHCTLPNYQPISRYPSIRRDLSLLVTKEQPSAPLLDTIQQELLSILEDIWIFDVYTGPGIAADLKSISLAMILRRPERTLLDEEINNAFDRLIAILKQQYGAVLRS